MEKKGKLMENFCLPMEHLKSTQERVQHVCMHSGSNWNLAVLVFEERGKLAKKPLRTSRGPTTNSTHINHDAGTGNRTWVTLVGGEISPLCHPVHKDLYDMTRRSLIRCLHC